MVDIVSRRVENIEEEKAKYELFLYFPVLRTKSVIKKQINKCMAEI